MKNKFVKIIFTFCLIALCALQCFSYACKTPNENDNPPPSADSVPSLKQAQTWYDTNGNDIQAHGGQIQKLTYTDRNGETVTRYWWVGEDKDNMSDYTETTNNGVHAYSSTDLVNWTDEGVVLRTPVTEEEMQSEYFSTLYAPDDRYPNSTPEFAYQYLKQKGAILERPKMIYNEQTGLYVIWFHMDNYDIWGSNNYTLSSAGVAVSENPWGPFRLIAKHRMYYDAENYLSDDAYGTVRDMNVYVEGDKAYLIYSSDWNSSLYIGLLDDTFTAPAVNPSEAQKGTHFVRLFMNGGWREAPAIAKIDGRYYMVTSGCEGWTPTRATCFSSDNLFSGWVNDGDPCVGENSLKTFGAQSTCIFQADGGWVFMSDVWGNGTATLDISKSRYLWLNVTIKDGKLYLCYKDEFIPDAKSFIAQTLTVSAESVKKVYSKNQTLSTDDLTVTCTYIDGTTAILNENQYNLFAPNLSELGAHRVEVCYGKLTASYYIAVVEQSNGYAVYTSDAKKTFSLGESVNGDGVKVFSYADNGALTEITDFSVTADTSTVGVKTATISVAQTEVGFYDVAVINEPELNVLSFENRTDTKSSLTLYITEIYDDNGNTRSSGFYLYSDQISVKIYRFSYKLDLTTWWSYFINGTGTESIYNVAGSPDNEGLFVTVGYDVFFADAQTWHSKIIGW